MTWPHRINLPRRAHVPGSGTEPDLEPLDAAKALAPAKTTAQEWQDNAAYLYGHILLKHGFCWEAHEVWEAVWLNCAPNSAEKVLLQALIQQANARLKRQMAAERAAKRLDQMQEQLRCDVLNRLPAGTAEFMGVNLSTPDMHFNA